MPLELRHLLRVAGPPGERAFASTVLISLGLHAAALVFWSWTAVAPPQFSVESSPSTGSFARVSFVFASEEPAELEPPPEPAPEEPEPPVEAAVEEPLPPASNRPVAEIEPPPVPPPESPPAPEPLPQPEPAPEAQPTEPLPPLPAPPAPVEPLVAAETPAPVPAASPAPPEPVPAPPPSPVAPAPERQPVRSASRTASISGPSTQAVPDAPRNRRPEYPPLARRRGWEGTVLLRVQVQADGRVARVVVARSSGFEVLDAAARSAIEQWKFLPAQRDGTPVPAWVELPVRFELRG